MCSVCVLCVCVCVRACVRVCVHLCIQLLQPCLEDIQFQKLCMHTTHGFEHYLKAVWPLLKVMLHTTV